MTRTSKGRVSVNSVAINRPVIIKAIVTPRLREELRAELDARQGQLELEMQQLDFQVKRINAAVERESHSGGQGQSGTGAQLSEAYEVSQQLRNERKKREEALAEVDERRQALTGLEDGGEILRGTLEGTVDVELGTAWDDIRAATIVLRDGVVVEIRHGA